MKSKEESKTSFKLEIFFSKQNKNIKTLFFLRFFLRWTKNICFLFVCKHLERSLKKKVCFPLVDGLISKLMCAKNLNRNKKQRKKFFFVMHS